jgi:hypothetical protein
MMSDDLEDSDFGSDPDVGDESAGSDSEHPSGMFVLRRASLM